ncbi:MAG: DUF2341 domain-containing protein [Bacteroidetes bacterium]|nr:DUF2341 domain-containing protein [Bacteroidota bacterium]
MANHRYILKTLLSSLIYLYLLPFTFCLFFSFNLLAQGGGVSINATGIAADNSAMLDVSATNQGMLIPRMTTLQRDDIASPAIGLIIFNIDCKNLNIYNGSEWESLNSTGGSAPGTAGSIMGTATICQGQSGITYSIVPVTNATAYSWSYSGSGFSITSGATTNSVTASFSGSATSGILTVYGTNVCGKGVASSGYLVTVFPVITAEVSIAASSNPICTGTEVTFTATPVNGGSTPSYQWKLNNVNVGTNSATYSNSALSNGDLVSCIMTSNATCVIGSPVTSNVITMSVNSYLPASVSIAASANPTCPSTEITFTATPVNGGAAPSYQWKFNSANVGTNSATYSNSGLINGDQVNCIMTSNYSCVTGSPATSNVITETVNPLAEIPVAIAGTAATQTQITANWNTTANATKYFVDVATDNGFTGILTNYNNIDVSNVLTYNVTGLSCGNTYYYRVRANNTCGTSSNSNTISYATTACCTGPPAQPGTISGNAIFCVASGQNYSISSVSEATTYTWAVPVGASINSGQGTTSISVNFGSSSGNVSVTAGNACGTSAASTLAVSSLTGWQYSAPLSVTNTSGVGLTDFQLRFTVTFASGKMKSDFSDLRFGAISGPILNYWIESYTSSTSAIVWVRVPSIPVSGTTINMFYGNSSATSLSNATNTFDFYDVCNASSTGWTATSEGVGSNTFSTSNGYFRLSGAGVCCSSSWGTAVVKKSLPSPLTSGSYVVSFQNRNSMGVCAGGGFNIISSNDGGATSNGGDVYVECDNANYCSGTPAGRISIAGNTGSAAYYSNNTGSSFTQYDIKPMNITNKTATLYKDGSSIVTASGGSVAPILTTISLSSSNNGYSNSVNIEDFQNIIIRKYASPEPSVTPGTEISCP